ncbi:MAG: hemerythrin domain-containing protein [Sandaracinaceae bacterium]|nr:hemerythrin domain-containing protein [Sandaracinaceae bacterium]
MTHGAIHAFLADDHARLDALLSRAVADADNVDRDAYAEFRAGLLRHIAMEEKVLLPDARRRREGEGLPVAKQLRADHSALAALLVPTPTHAILAAIRGILEVHNQLEEGPAGVYTTCEELAGEEADSLLLRLRAVPEVPVAPHVDSPRVHEHIASLLKKAKGDDRE